MFIDNNTDFFICPILTQKNIKCERDEYIKQHSQVKSPGQHLITMHNLRNICLTCANRYSER